MSSYKYARLAGLPEVAELLAQAGARESLGTGYAFVAACACRDEAEARRLLAQNPDMFERLGEQRLRYLPEMVWNAATRP